MTRAPRRPGQALELLILDDVAALRESIAWFVQDIVPVVQAGTVAEALAIGESRNIGGAILDVRLANGESGLTVLEGLQSARSAPLPVIVLTGLEREDLDLAPAAHHAIYVQKPAGPEVLEPLLRRFAKRVVAWPVLAPFIDRIGREAHLSEAETRLVKAYFHLNRRELSEALARSPGTIENTVTGINRKLQTDHLSDLWQELVFDLGIALGEGDGAACPTTLRGRPPGAN